MAEEFTDRAYVSRYQAADFGLQVMRDGVAGDADGGVTVELRHDDAAQTVVFSRAADHPGLGQYTVRLSSRETAEPGPYVLVWLYTVAGSAEEWRYWLEVGKAAPEYDRLADPMKSVIETTWNRFSDLFDYATEGPASADVRAVELRPQPSRAAAADCGRPPQHRGAAVPDVHDRR
jgi:hypothetical protein